MERSIDKRKAWREQEERLVARWNAAEARYRNAQAEMARQQPSAGDEGSSEALRLEVQASLAEIEAVRRQVARLKVEFTSGKRY